MRKLPLLASSALTLSLACASDPTSKVIDALSELSTVYVPIEAASLLSLNGALEEKGYGNVTIDDFKRQFVYSQTSFGPAVIAYSSEEVVPESALFEPMSLTEWLRSALEDESASGVVLDPESGSPLTLSKNDIGRALAELPAQPDAPMELHR